MKFKLDENFGTRGAGRLGALGHDVATVAEQNLCSSTDTALIDVCHAEGRCLVTMDLDFSNPIRFPPRNYSGIVVFRLPARAGVSEIEAAIDRLASTVGTDALTGKLWIVELYRVREYADDPLPSDDEP